MKLLQEPKGSFSFASGTEVQDMIIGDTGEPYINKALEVIKGIIRHTQAAIAKIKALEGLIRPLKVFEGA